jgi:hypothetical protein
MKIGAGLVSGLQLVDKVNKLYRRATEVKSKALNRSAIEAYK